MSTHDPDYLLSLTEAAQILGHHNRWVKEMTQQGWLRCFRSEEGARRYIRSEVEEFAVRLSRRAQGDRLRRRKRAEAT